MNNGKAILAVLAGIAAGTAFGRLLAPGKGADSRKRISKKGEDLADALNEMIDTKFEELLSNIAGKVKNPTSRHDSIVHKNEMVG